MGLIMLILIGTVPTAYALNHAVSQADSQDFIAVSAVAAETLAKYATPGVAIARRPARGGDGVRAQPDHRARRPSVRLGR